MTILQREAASSPPTSAAAARRAAILAIARAQFLAGGYAATSMSDIAARLGGSKGTLYAYFRSKEALFQAVADQEAADLQAQLFDLDEPESAPAARLTALAQRFLTALMRPDTVAFHRLVIAESDRFPDLGRAFFEIGPRVIRARIATILELLMAHGELRAADSTEAAEVFVDLAIAGPVLRRLWSVQDPPQEAARHVAVSVALFLRAYAPDPTRDPPG